MPTIRILRHDGTVEREYVDPEYWGVAGIGGQAYLVRVKNSDGCYDEFSWPLNHYRVEVCGLSSALVEARDKRGD